jgi:iron complex outermembrane receptor protein
MTQKRDLTVLLLTLFLSLFFIQTADSQEYTVSGKIKDAVTGEGLIGASVVIENTTIGSVTDLDGNFEFKTNQEPPFDLVISFIGYISITYTLLDITEPIKVELRPDQVMMDEVQIVGSRISEKQQMAALTTESMDVLAIKEAASGDFYESLGNLKGVDVTASSLGFKVVNTRGFNSTSPVRSLQLIDGVDNQSPGLNFSLGNFLGTPDLDVMNVEIVAGASSAFFGPGAFNGVINMTSKSPWLFPGLAAEVKVGERDLTQASARWAQIIKNKEGQEKFAYKINLFGMRANDWEANNLNASTTSEDLSSNFAGFDAVNRYGDEVLAGGNDYSSNPNTPGLGRIYRTGYLERDIVDYNTDNFKGNVGLYYKIFEDVELNYVFCYSTGTTVYQGDNRYSLKDIQFFQHKFQISKPGRFFLRAYATTEDAGNSYDAVVTAFEMSETSKAEGVFYKDYAQYYQNNIVPRMYEAGLPTNEDTRPSLVQILNECGCSLDEALLIFQEQNITWQAETNALQDEWITQNTDSMMAWHAETRLAADNLTASTSENPRFEPGTERYDSLLNDVTNRLFTEGGSRFYDKSSLYNIDGQYNFNLGKLGITVGGNYRMYNPDSRGTIFADTLTYRRETVVELDSIFFGGEFIRVDTNFNEVKVDSSYRKITNWNIGGYLGLNYKILQDRMVFDATVRVDKNENFDPVVSPALSVVFNPVNDHTFRATYSTAVRNPTMADQFLYYDVGRAILIGNLNGYDSLVTIESFGDALNGFPNFDDTQLEYFNVASIRPEQVRTIELGYRGMIKEKLYLDVSYYHSWYTNFIGFNIGIDVGLSVDGQLTSAQVYRIAANATNQVTTQGITIGANYYIGNNWVVNGNYSFNKLNLQGSEDPIIPAFNTPENKFNIGINGRDFTLFGARYFGFGVNYKWIQGFEFEGSPQFTGFIDSYSMVDAQVNYRWQKTNLTFKLGASNVLNNEVYTVYGGPLIGRLAYFSVSYDWINR